MTYGTDTYRNFSIPVFSLTFFSALTPLEALAPSQNLTTPFEDFIIFFEAFITPSEAVTNPF